jgi:hypothetical protein
MIKLKKINFIKKWKKNSSQPGLTWLTCVSVYEIRIILQKKKDTDHDTQSPISKYQMMKLKKKINF